MSLVTGKQMNDVWKEETPTGTINGSNVSFSLSLTPVANDSVAVYLDGLILRYTTDYTISGTTITMVTAPAFGQVLYAEYIHK